MKRFSASAAPMLMQCAASGDLETAIPGWVAPEVDHDAGAKGKGTQIHKVFEDAMAFTARDAQCIGQAMTYVAELRQTRRFKIITEATTTAEFLQQKPHSTVDLVLYTKDELHIVDYKTGKIPVYPQFNKQLMYYAACFSHLAPNAQGVTLHIVQPWADVMESWFCSTIELMEFIVEAQITEQNILAKRLAFQPGDHCTFCPANPAGFGDKAAPYCPAMLSMLYPLEVDEDEILGMV